VSPKRNVKRRQATHQHAAASCKLIEATVQLPLVVGFGLLVPGGLRAAGDGRWLLNGLRMIAFSLNTLCSLPSATRTCLLVLPAKVSLQTRISRLWQGGCELLPVKPAGFSGLSAPGLGAVVSRVRGCASQYIETGCLLVWSLPIDTVYRVRSNESGTPCH
jgi:hypothetical protein